ncbi:hypothetical protein [Pedobacter cryoconitis]|uniref:Lipoprotein n=1 Tax=Pedobacter cryoconitis TaxID=188932 RepID=A0A7X0MGR8_9SPHI|nr:hypothetical protein [Pedobacter cryoconitis]MBB6498364.1 hypothetical protein [Pedobacter cryoconitis]
MKTFKTLLLLTVVASLLSSCFVQEPGYHRHYRHDGYGYRGY